MMTVRKFLAICALAALSSCRTQQLNSGVKDYARQPKILLVGSGGWSSCDDPLNPYNQRIVDSMTNLGKNLEEYAQVKMVFVCLNIIPPSRPNAYIGVGIATTSQVSSRRFYPSQPLLASQLPEYIRSIQAQYNPDQVYFVGHSYGGWVVLNLDANNVRSDAIFTLDPIDAQNCLLRDNFFSGLGIGSPNCQVGPLIIRTSTKGIFNMWQEFGPIHSSELTATNVENMKIDVNHSVYAGDQAKKTEAAHRMIGSYPEAWGAICDAIFAANGWDRNLCTTIDTNEAGRYSQDANVVYNTFQNTNFLAGGGNNVRPQDPPLDDIVPDPNQRPDVGGKLCGHATTNSKFCIDRERNEITLSNPNRSTSCQITGDRESTLMPGGRAYYCNMNVQGLTLQNGMRLTNNHLIAFLVREKSNGNYEGRIVAASAGNWVDWGTKFDLE